MSGHGEYASAICNHGSSPHHKTASYSGTLDEVAEKALTFVHTANQEEVEREAAEKAADSAAAE